MVLYINCCVRSGSRTNKIAKALLDKFNTEYTELYLPDLNLQSLSEETLEKRTKLIEKGDYSDTMFDLANTLGY